MKTGRQTTRDTNSDEREMEVEINQSLEEENPQILDVDMIMAEEHAENNLVGIGHPTVPEIDNDNEEDKFNNTEDTEVHAEINLEGVGHPIVADADSDDGEDKLNDTEEITDEMLGPDDEINLPDIREETNLPEAQIEVPERRKQPSLIERRRTRCMTAAAKRTERKEQWMLFKEGNWTKP